MLTSDARKSRRSTTRSDGSLSGDSRTSSCWSATRRPWESVLESDRRSVELVTIGGDLAYGRPDWVATLADAAAYEPCLAWGKPMLIDLRYRRVSGDGPERPALSELRRRLLGRYPQAGPIFA